MATTVLLAIGDTQTGSPPVPASGDYLNLNGNPTYASTGYIINGGTLNTDAMHLTRRDQQAFMEVPSRVEQVQASGLRKVALSLVITGTSSDDLQAKIRAVYKKQNQARIAAGASSVWNPVCLWVKYGSASNFVYFDVVNITIIPVDTTGGVDGLTYGLDLDLWCLPAAHGDAITKTATATIVNGAPGAFFSAAIEGDIDALCQVIVTDVSTGGFVINRIRLARRSLATMASTDFVPVLNATPLGSATNQADATCINSDRAQLVMAAGSDWANHAKVLKGAGQYTYGLLDVWARVRDQETIATQASTPQGTLSTAAGALPGGSYVLAVTGIDAAGNETLPSPISKTLTSKLAVLIDGFEAGNLNLWSQYITGNGALVVQTLHPHTGTNALQANGNSTGDYAAVFVPFPSAGPPLAALQAWHYSGGANTLPVNFMQINKGTNPTTPIVALQYASSTTWKMILTNRDGTTQGSATYTFTNATYYRLELQYDTTGTYPVARFYVNGTLQATLTDRSFGSATPATHVSIGVHNMPTYTGNDVLYFDDCAVDTKAIGTGAQTTQIAWTWIPGQNISSQRIYVAQNGGAWQYTALAGVNGSYTLANLTGFVTGNPPATSPYGVQLRAAATVPGTAQAGVYAAPVQIPQVAGGNVWQDVYLGAFPLPPIATQEGQSSQTWEFDIASKPATLTNAPTADIDAVFVLPRDEPQCLIEYPNLALTTKMVWRIDTRRDGRSSCQLESPAGTIQGAIPVTGQFTVGPNDSEIVVMVEAGVTDVQTVSISGTPTGGSFTLTFGGQTTAAIVFNSTAANMQTLLTALSSIGTSNVACTGGPLPGTPIVCTFIGALANTPLAVMTKADSFTGGSSPATTVTHTTTGLPVSSDVVSAQYTVQLRIIPRYAFLRGSV